MSSVIRVRGRARRAEHHHEPDRDQRRHRREEYRIRAARARRTRPARGRAAGLAPDGRRVTHRRAPAGRLRPPRTLAALFGRGEHVERRAARREQHDVAAFGSFRARARPLRPSTRPAGRSTPPLVRGNRFGGLADRTTALARRESLRPSRRTRCPSSGRRRSERSAGRTRSAPRSPPGIGRLRIVDVEHAVDFGDRLEPVRQRAERLHAFAQRLRSQPMASATSIAAMTFSTLCSPASGISARSITAIGRGSPVGGA